MEDGEDLRKLKAVKKMFNGKVEAVFDKKEGEDIWPKVRKWIKSRLSLRGSTW